jgi:hypothetical protein
LETEHTTIAELFKTAGHSTGAIFQDLVDWKLQIPRENYVLHHVNRVKSDLLNPCSMEQNAGVTKIESVLAIVQGEHDSVVVKELCYRPECRGVRDPMT